MTVWKYDRDAVDAIAKFLLDEGEMDIVSVEPGPSGRTFRVEGLRDDEYKFAGMFGRGHGDPFDPECWMDRLSSAGLLR